MAPPLYFDDPWTCEFEASVSALGVAGERPFVVLDRSYFYPEGGGQRADRGWLDDVEVVDCQLQEGQVRHFLARALDPAAVGRFIRARIDRDRRMDHIQQHTGQHLLSAVFIEVARKDTVSFHMGEDDCTIDLETSELTRPQVDAVEDRAAQIIAGDRPVRVLYPSPDQLAGLALRKDPQVEGQARVIEIEGLDLSPCGGTHCTRTGQLGSIHVRRWERVRKLVRVHFLVGLRAVRDHRARTRIVQAVGTCLSTPDDQIEARVTDLLERQKTQDKELGQLRADVWKGEAATLLETATWVGGRRLIATPMDGPAPRLAASAQRLALESGLVAWLWMPTGEVVLAAASDTDVNAGAWLTELARAHGGKGGGQSTMAQGRLPPATLTGAAQQIRERLTALGGDPGTRGRWSRDHVTKDGTAFRVREALPEDAAAFAVFGERLIPTAPMLARDVADDAPAPAERAARLADTHRTQTSINLMAHAGEAVVGTLSFRADTKTRTRHRGELGMAVDSDWRGRGVGRALLEDLLAWCRRGGVIRRIALGVFPQNAQAIALYRSLGFVEEGRSIGAFRVDGQPVDEIRMGLILVPSSQREA